MEVKSSLLESSGEDSILIETVKSIVTREQRNGSESDEDFFLVPQDQYTAADVEVTTSHKCPTDGILAWTDLCRICANANDHSIPIFEGEGAEHDLFSKILKYLPIHVSKSDTLPLQLCYHCAATLLAWHELSEGCLDAERRLLEMQNAMQDKHQYYNATVLDNLRVSVPDIATIDATNAAALQSDQQVDEGDGTCEAGEIDKSNRSCGVRTPFRVFLDTQNIFWKPYRKRSAEPAHARKPSTAEDYDSVWIAVMDTTLDQSPALPRQPQNNDLLRPAAETQEVPLATQHPAKDAEQECEPCRTAIVDCKEEASERDEILDDDTPDDETNDEESRETSKSHKQCSECGKCFKLKDSYLRHMRIHKDERPFTCHVCGKQFRDSGGLTRHLKDVHAKLKNFMCDLCDRSFASKATREDHRRTHTGERPYVCDSCGKTFKSKASLYIHSKLHTDEFPHACSYCLKRFRRRQEVLAHITTHTGEKNHACDACGKKFRIKSELARHKLIHSDNKPFVCVKCGLAFRQKRYLNNHIKNRHNETQRMCGPTSGKSFAAYYSSLSALWVNNAAITHGNDPRNAAAATILTPTARNAKEITGREIRDSDNNGAVEFDDKVDLNVSRCRELKSTVSPSMRKRSTRTDYTCDNCQRTFGRKYHLIRHITSCGTINEHNSSTTRAKVKEKKRRTDGKSAKRKSSIRSKDCTSTNEGQCRARSERSRVSPRKRSEAYPCNHCEYTAEKRKLLNAHLAEAHPEFARKNRKSFVESETVLRARMEHDGKVYYHCGECGKNLNSPYTFYWHIRIHTGERLFTCHLCGKRFRVNQGLARHLRETHAGIKNVPCDLCGRMFSTRRNAEDHRRIHTGERPYVCNVCGKTFKQKASLFVHNRTHSDVFPFKCSHCEQTFRTRPSLMVHITKHTGEKPYACDVCGRCFRIKYELKRHRLIHSDEKPWHCTDCDLSFRQKRYLVNHKRLNHESSRRLIATKLKSLITYDQTAVLSRYSRNARKIFTQKCRNDSAQTKTLDVIDEKNRPSLSSLANDRSVQHLSHHDNASSRTHSLDKSTNYEEKHESTKDRNSSPVRETPVDRVEETRDERDTSGEDAIEESSAYPTRVSKQPEKSASGPLSSLALVCKYCGKKFRSRKSYRAHSRTHTGEKSYTCHVCGKQFVQSGSLYYHLKHVHDGVKNHACDICGRSFAMKNVMEDHRRIHTGERPYVCHTCGKTFKTKASLYIHGKTHTDEYPHRCVYCAKRFRWRQQMLGHLTVHTGEKNHACDVCGKAFGVKNDLTRHKRVHSEKKPYTCQQCGISFGQKRYLKSHERLTHV